jgi:hypothetical protein
MQRYVLPKMVTLGWIRPLTFQLKSHEALSFESLKKSHAFFRLNGFLKSMAHLVIDYMHLRENESYIAIHSSLCLKSFFHIYQKFLVSFSLVLMVGESFAEDSRSEFLSASAKKIDAGICTPHTTVPAIKLTHLLDGVVFISVGLMQE